MDKKPIKKTTPTPWERQQNETPPAFEAFALYRDMGESRSYAKVAVKLGKSTTIITRWGGTHNWVERVAEWDNEQDKIVREALTKGVTAMRKKHADLANAILIKATIALQQLPIAEMSPRDISTMVDIASKLERISRGEATERVQGNTEHSGKITFALDPYEELTTEELKQLARLADENISN
ncbi:MAG: hypothetical protein LBT88_05980 [Oscillospiraceae bacterium]|jgi:hypothetical protein|nr:hypothetical protein [Oscillospiraceae bacterium]